MKPDYQPPKMEVIFFGNIDVLTDSDSADLDNLLNPDNVNEYPLT